ncbi:MAG: hypothetical protein HKO59_13285 [Phycisphaerales bacterium]|nr:hypothetical protein [Phycisphaerales bacterium]
MTTIAASPPVLRPADVLQTWWPLAASWLLMGAEIPMVAAVVSRLGQPDIHLAAFGGVVFPLALVIEAPIIMMLAASTALCRDEASYRRLKRFMITLSATLTVLHLLLVTTDAFEWVAGVVIGAPAEIVAPARLGFALMLPWTWAIADRRFHQGLLIRLGHQRQIGVGTAARLVGTLAVLGVGLTLDTIPGVAVAAAAMSTGVLVEAAYARGCIAMVRLDPILTAAPQAVPLTSARLWHFYVPLALTPLIALIAQPIGSAGISRMPLALTSLAVWPVLNGLAFMLRSIGVAYNEVVVRHCEVPGGSAVLGRTAWCCGAAASLVLALFAATPLAEWWFAGLSGLDAELTTLGRRALWFGVPLPLLSFLHSYYQGLLVTAHRTRGITEAVAVFLIVTAIGLWIGVATEALPGAAAALAAMSAGSAAQAGWLRWRCGALVRG